MPLTTSQQWHTNTAPRFGAPAKRSDSRGRAPGLDHKNPPGAKARRVSEGITLGGAIHRPPHVVCWQLPAPYSLCLSERTALPYPGTALVAVSPSAVRSPEVTRMRLIIVTSEGDFYPILKGTSRVVQQMPELVGLTLMDRERNIYGALDVYGVVSVFAVQLGEDGDMHANGVCEYEVPVEEAKRPNSMSFTALRVHNIPGQQGQFLTFGGVNVKGTGWLRTAKLTPSLTIDHSEPIREGLVHPTCDKGLANWCCLSDIDFCGGIAVHSTSIQPPHTEGCAPAHAASEILVTNISTGHTELIARVVGGTVRAVMVDPKRPGLIWVATDSLQASNFGELTYGEFLTLPHLAPSKGNSLWGIRGMAPGPCSKKASPVKDRSPSHGLHFDFEDEEPEHVRHAPQARQLSLDNSDIVQGSIQGDAVEFKINSSAVEDAGRQSSEGSPKVPMRAAEGSGRATATPDNWHNGASGAQGNGGPANYAQSGPDATGHRIGREFGEFDGNGIGPGYTMDESAEQQLDGIMPPEAFNGAETQTDESMCLSQPTYEPPPLRGTPILFHGSLPQYPGGATQPMHANMNPGMGMNANMNSSMGMNPNINPSMGMNPNMNPALSEHLLNLLDAPAFAKAFPVEMTELRSSPPPFSSSPVPFSGQEGLPQLFEDTRLAYMRQRHAGRVL